MHVYHPPSAPKSVPVIDISSTSTGDEQGRQDAAAAIHRACREMGFFYVSHHGVSDDLIKAQFGAAKALFDLPLAEKQALHVKNSKTVAGYSGLGTSALDSQELSSEKAPADLNESFYLGRELPAGTSYDTDTIVRTFGHNQWPARLPEFRTQTLKYYDEMKDLANRILTLLAVSLDLSPAWFDPLFERSVSAIRMLKYPPQPVQAERNQLGAGAHTDWSAMTVLAQDDVGGLEVRNVDGEWISAPPIPGTFVVNLGDLMARWTNGLYNSNFHRVRNNNSDRDRYSLPFFHGPSPFSRIEAIPTCVDETNPRRFATCTTMEHLDEMYRRSHGYLPSEVAATLV